jgi:putative heme transporter
MPENGSDQIVQVKATPASKPDWWNLRGRRPSGRRTSGPGVTAIVCSLAFVALVNAVISAARILSAGGQRDLGRLPVFVGLAILLSLWALARVRRQRNQDAGGFSAQARQDQCELDAGSGLGVFARRASWLRWAGQALMIGVLALAALAIASQWHTLTSGFDRLGDLRWHDLRWAVYAEVLSLIYLAQLTRLLLRTGGERVRFSSILALTVAASGMAATLPGGPALAATFSFDQLRRRGVRMSMTAYALALTWVLSGAALVAIALVGTGLAGSTGPAASLRLPVAAAAAFLTAVALACVLALRLARCRARLTDELDRLSRRPRFSRAAQRLRQWTDELANVRLPAVVLLRGLAAAALSWAFDCACLALSILAVGGHVPWQDLLAVYCLTQLAAALPLTPGGIGIVEGTLSLLLVAYHMPAATAIAAVILYRILSCWILLPAGWATAGTLIALHRRRRAGLALLPPTTAARRAPAPTG